MCVCVCVLYSIPNKIVFRLNNSYCGLVITLACKWTIDCVYSDLSGASRQAGACVDRHGYLHHDEPWLRRSFQPARQPEEAVPLPGHDQAGPSAHCRGHALLPGFPHRRETCLQDRTVLQVSIHYVLS